jgi:hypothetical protein
MNRRFGVAGRSAETPRWIYIICLARGIRRTRLLFCAAADLSQCFRYFPGGEERSPNIPVLSALDRLLVTAKDCTGNCDCLMVRIG